MKSLSLNARINIVSGLYVITPDEADTAELLRKVRLALLGAARVLQYRNKMAGALRELACKFAVPLIINGDAVLAQQVAAG